MTKNKKRMNKICKKEEPIQKNQKHLCKKYDVHLHSISECFINKQLQSSKQFKSLTSLCNCFTCSHISYSSLLLSKIFFKFYLTNATQNKMEF